ncbi:MAG TPA: cytochrome c peroxidase [Hyphomonadaceae bacterium]|nr:cytochrome c peroxidase [Hyphomonadaceae bacterium]
MARFLVVAIILVAIGYLGYKYLLGKGDVPPADAKATANAKADGKSDAAKTQTAGEKAAADATADTQVSTDLQSGGVKPKLDAAKNAKVTGESISKMLPTETVSLGDPSLTAGIPGEGDLTNEQIDKWLADSKNHVVLKPELPLGLKAGEGEIKGLDDNPLTRAKIELGRQLYFDPRLSSDVTISCASCHDPAKGYASGTRFGVGVRGQQGGRNSPAAYNRIFSGPQFWDGRAESLEDQAKGPIANPIEMSNTHEACVTCLKGIPGYVRQFNKVFKDGLTIDNVAKAIASFERVLVTGPAPWDYYQQRKSLETAFAADIEDLEAFKKDDPENYAKYAKAKEASEKHPISESAIRGGELFFSEKAGCTACHLGANFTDEKYHNLGVGMEAEKPDLGRFEITKIEKEKGAFKTPTVRNVAMTAPYMHDGSQKTLEEVVEWYAKGGHPNQWLDEKIKKLELTDQAKKDLVAFMKEGLTGELPKVNAERLLPDAEQAKEESKENLQKELKEAGAK